MARKSLSGLTDEGSIETARLTIGLRADRPRSESITKRKGAIIRSDRARRELFRLRATQVGKKAASATLIKCQGLWEGRGEEPTLTCEIEFMPSENESSPSVFRRNMEALAEQAALVFGQEEVWLRVGGRLRRANAPDEQGPPPIRRGGRIIR